MYITRLFVFGEMQFSLKFAFYGLDLDGTVRIRATLAVVANDHALIGAMP
jgi:hypothetical protein